MSLPGRQALKMMTPRLPPPGTTPPLTMRSMAWRRTGVAWACPRSASTGACGRTHRAWRRKARASCAGGRVRAWSIWSLNRHAAVRLRGVFASGECCQLRLILFRTSGRPLPRCCSSSNSRRRRAAPPLECFLCLIGPGSPPRRTRRTRSSLPLSSALRAPHHMLAMALLYPTSPRPMGRSHQRSRLAATRARLPPTHAHTCSGWCCKPLQR